MLDKKIYTKKQVDALKARLYNAAVKERQDSILEYYDRGFRAGKNELREAFRKLLEPQEDL